MRRLVIDDIRTFEFPDGGETVHVRTIFDALPYLDQKWDECWWDHDMGYVNGGDTSLLANLIDNLVSTGEKPKPDLGRCVVHTFNPVAAPYLIGVLSKYWPTRRASYAEIESLLVGD